MSWAQKAKTYLVFGRYTIDRLLSNCCVSVPKYLQADLSYTFCGSKSLHSRFSRVKIVSGAMPTSHAVWLIFWLISFQTILVSGQWGPVSQVNGVDTYQATPVQVELQTCVSHVL